MLASKIRTFYFKYYYVILSYYSACSKLNVVLELSPFSSEGRQRFMATATLKLPKKPIDLLLKIRTFIKSHTVLLIAFFAMLMTCFIVPFDDVYFTYIDFKTLACLFLTLTVVEAYKHIHFFEIISRKIIEKLHNLRNTILAVVLITFFGSMLLANDMALLTFLPLGFFVLDSTGQKKYMAFTFIMQTIAANLGGMITPFGNPQNLYLYNYFNIDTLEFTKIMSIPFATATILIIICCMFIKKEPLHLVIDYGYKINKNRTIIYSILFTISILMIFKIIPYIYSISIVVIALLFLDRRALTDIDYPLLLTFVCFFIFSGNMSRIAAVQEFFAAIMPSNPLLVGILSCQVISNVPSAILLSRFTTDYANLLVAVNIGGCGTLIASMASLITFGEYRKNNPNKSWSYILQYSAFNFGFIIILVLVQSII